MFQGHKIALIIPAFDEEEAIGQVVAGVDRDIVDKIIVADNGSTDATAERARQAGAIVVREERRGYGSACLAGIAAGEGADIFTFMDGDGSDDPAQLGVVHANASSAC